MATAPSPGPQVIRFGAHEAASAPATFASNLSASGCSTAWSLNVGAEAWRP